MLELAVQPGGKLVASASAEVLATDSMIVSVKPGACRSISAMIIAVGSTEQPAGRWA